jgi:hypothetical protein
MAPLTAIEVARYAKQAGFTGASLITAVAIAKAESGWRPDAVGDKNLTEPGEESVGLWQINFRPRRDQPGSLRDPGLNLEPLHNAVAAYVISGRGSNFGPWSTYTNGAYRAYLAAAAEAVAALGVGPDRTGGSFVPLAPSHALIGIAMASDGKGYAILAGDGAVYCFGVPYAGRLEMDDAGNWQPVVPTP